MATLPSEQTALAELLKSTFPASNEVNSFLPEVLRWKYFSPHPDWSAPRSYVVKKDEAMVGHGGIWPLRFAGENRELSVIHLIDWAASRAAAGTGVLLLRKLAGLADVLLTIGGSDETQSILPKLGYQQCGDLKLQAKVVRPWLQFRTASETGWKRPVRLVRNTIWSLPALPSAPVGWRALRIDRFDASVEPVLNHPSREDLYFAANGCGVEPYLRLPGCKICGISGFP